MWRFTVTPPLLFSKHGSEIVYSSLNDFAVICPFNVLSISVGLQTTGYKPLYFHPTLPLTGRQTSRRHWRRGRRRGRGLLHRGQCVWQQRVWQVWEVGVSCWLCSGTWGPLKLQLVYRNSQSWKVQSLEVKIPRCWSHWSEGPTWRCKLSYSEFLPPAKRQTDWIKTFDIVNHGIFLYKERVINIE